MCDLFRYVLAFFSCVFFVASSEAFGQQVPPRMIEDAEARLWYGVAKLNVAGEGWCNAVLISDTEALTAAHCLYRQRIEKFADTEEIKLELGLRRNERISVHGVAAFSVLDKASGNLTGEIGLEQISSDLALLLLDAPVSSDVAEAFSVRDWRPGESVTVVGYDSDRPYIPSVRENFVITPVSETVAKLDCAISPGLSGAAVVSQSNDQSHPQLLGIISASLVVRSYIESCGALAITIGPRLEKLRSQLP